MYNSKVDLYYASIRKALLCLMVFTLAVLSLSTAQAVDIQKKVVIVGNEDNAILKVFGVMTQSLTGDLREYFKLKKGRTGVLITRVYQSSPADQAGMKVGDIILTLDGKTISSEDELIEILEENAAQSHPYKVAVFRKGDKEKLVVKMPQFDAEDDENDDESPNTFKFMFDDDVVRDLSDFASGWRGPHNFLGVKLSDLTPGLRDYFGIKDDLGVLVEEVIPNTPADKAGLRAGDVILRIDDKDMHNAGEVREYITSLEKEAAISLLISRKGEEREVRTALAYREGRHYREFVKPWCQGFKSMHKEFKEKCQPKLDETLRELKKDLEQLKDEMRSLRKELKNSKVD